jgi:hypothetical protein
MTSGTPPTLFKLTPGQSLLWIEGQLHPGVPLNHMVTRLDISRAIDVEACQRAFSRLVERHDAMRLIVSSDGLQFLATVSAQQPPPLSFIDFSAEFNAAQSLQAWIQQRCRRVFQLNEFLYEASLVRLAADKFVFFMIQHHCVTDGRSCQVMLADLDALYQQQLTAGSSQQGGRDVTPCFADYLVAQADYLGSQQAQASEAYWNERYRDAPEPVSFYGRSADMKRLSSARHGTLLPASLANRIVAGKQETPPSMVFAAVLFAFLHRTTGNSDLWECL